MATLRIGGADVFFDDVYLGYTEEGVKLTIEDDVEEVSVDEVGTTPIEVFRKGKKIKAEAIFVDWNQSNIATLLGGSVLNSGVEIGNDLGFLSKKKLRIQSRADANDYFEFPNAVLRTAAEIEYTTAGAKKRGMKVEFIITVDDTTNKFGNYGNTSA